MALGSCGARGGNGESSSSLAGAGEATAVEGPEVAGDAAVGKLSVLSASCFSASFFSLHAARRANLAGSGGAALGAGGGVGLRRRDGERRRFWAFSNVLWSFMSSGGRTSGLLLLLLAPCRGRFLFPPSLETSSPSRVLRWPRGPSSALTDGDRFPRRSLD